MTLLPSSLDIPVSTAAGIEFVGANLTARDLSYAISAAWLAARMAPEQGTVDHYRIPDNALRAALGRTRRDSIDTETARFDRLRDGIIRTDYDFPMPTVMYRGDIPVRHNLDDELTWYIHPSVVELFKPASPSIAFPIALLANARNRATIETVLRMLAQHARGPSGREVRAWGPDRIGVLYTFEELGRRFHIDTKHPSVTIQRYLAPVADDAFAAAGISFQYEARRTSTIRNPNGRYRDILLYLAMPAPSPLSDAIRQQELNEGSWRSRTPSRRRGRPAKSPLPAVADTDNVVALRGPVRFTVSPFGKMLGNGSVDSKDDDATLEF